MTTHSPGQTEKWARAAATWHSASPPATPSRDDLKAYRYIIEKRERQRIVILGCTPSLRRLVAYESTRRPSQTIVVDSSPEMWRSTDLLIDEKWEEVRLVSDWLSFDVPSGAASIVLGDKVLDNLAYEAWPQFFAHLHRILEPGGVFVTHVGMNDVTLAGSQPSELLTRWTDRYLRNECNLSEAGVGLWEDLLTSSGWKDPDSRRLSISNWSIELNELETEAGPGGALSNASSAVFRAFTQQFGDHLEDWWTDCRLVDLVGASQSWFDLRDILFSSDYPAARHQPILEFVAREDIEEP